MTVDNSLRFTAADIEALTQGAVDRKTTENWHNRSLWLTPAADSPPRGRARLYSLAHLFEAHTRAALVEGGFTHAAARTAIELRLAEAALAKERERTRRQEADFLGHVVAAEVPREIYSLPELKQPNVNWYWAIYFSYYDKKVSELARTIAFKDELSMADLFTSYRVGTILHISAVVQDVLAYVEQRDDTGSSRNGAQTDSA